MLVLYSTTSNRFGELMHKESQGNQEFHEKKSTACKRNQEMANTLKLNQVLNVHWPADVAMTVIEFETIFLSERESRSSRSRGFQSLKPSCTVFRLYVFYGFSVKQI
jgi:hypothetical protein